MKRAKINAMLMAVALGGAALPTPAATNLFKRIETPTEPNKPAMIIAEGMPKLHLSHVAFDEKVATNALSLYLNMLDFDHTFFLASDVAEFQQHGPLLAQALRAGDVRIGVEIFNRFMERMTNRIAYVGAALKRGFDTSKQEAYTWKRKDAPWAASEAEWNDLWRRKVENEYLGRIVAIKLADEEKAQEKKKKGLLGWLKKGDAKNVGKPGVKDAKAPAQEAKPAVKEEDEDSAEPQLTPDQFILKRYAQFQTVLQDSDLDWVLQRYLMAFTMAYDPHSEYFMPSTEEDFDISMRLFLCGIGAVLSPEDGAAKVERLTAGGPAERDGRLKPGDKIIAVAQGDKPAKDILHLPLNKTVRLIRGDKGTKVVLTVVSKNDVTMTKPRKIDLIRDEIKLEESRAKEELRSEVTPGVSTQRFAVVTIPEFYADMKGQQAGKRDATSVARDVRKMLGGLATQQVDGVVLDLRNNGGGSLEEAVELTGQFIGSGPIVQVRQQQNEVQVLVDTDPSVHYAGPLVVLVNRLSASASEILTAALQDYGRALVVGDSKTHGKGTVQTLLPMAAGAEKLGALKLTTASFYRIAGGSTQLRGVEPDIVVPSTLDSMEIGEEFLPNALPWNTVEPSGYARDRALQPLIPELRKLSAGRLAHDPRFASHRKLLERSAERVKSKEVSLNLNARLAEARADRDVEKLQQQEDEAVTVGKEKKKKNDVVLDETLHILADFIKIAHAPRIAAAVTAP
jgi:carboxyl-terminal processing protease